MIINEKNIIKWLKFAHWLGVVGLAIGGGLLIWTELSLQVAGMLIIATLIGGGLMLMSPYPVVLFIQWVQNQPDSNL